MCWWGGDSLKISNRGAWPLHFFLTLSPINLFYVLLFSSNDPFLNKFTVNFQLSLIEWTPLFWHFMKTWLIFTIWPSFFQVLSLNSPLFWENLSKRPLVLNCCLSIPVISILRIPLRIDCMWCDQAKWVWSRKFLFFAFWHFLLGYYLSFNLVRTPWRLGNWFLRNSILSDCKNNEKQKKLSALFGYIFRLMFASSDSFCLIASHTGYIQWILLFSY